MWIFSITIYTIVIFLANVKLALHTRFWTTLNWSALILTSVGLYFAFVCGSQFMESSYAYMVPLGMMTTSYFWLTVFLITGAIFAFDMCVFMILKLNDDKLDQVLKIFMKKVPKYQDKTPEGL